MIHFFLMVNKHGQTRLADYFTKHPDQTVESRAAEEAEIVRKCLARKDNQVWLRHASSCATIQTHQILLFPPLLRPSPSLTAAAVRGGSAPFSSTSKRPPRRGKSAIRLKLCTDDTRPYSSSWEPPMRSVFYLASPLGAMLPPLLGGSEAFSKWLARALTCGRCCVACRMSWRFWSLFILLWKPWTATLRTWCVRSVNTGVILRPG